MRAVAVQKYIIALARGLEPLGKTPFTELLIVDYQDWTKRTRLPGGFPARVGNERKQILVTARFPERLIWKSREALVSAGRMPFEIDDLFDLWIGFEYCHGFAFDLGLITRSKSTDELVTALLFLSGLEASDTDLHLKALSWAQYLSGLDKAPALPQKPKSLREQLLLKGAFLSKAANLLEHNFEIDKLISLEQKTQKSLKKFFASQDSDFGDWLERFKKPFAKISKGPPEEMSWEELEKLYSSGD